MKIRLEPPEGMGEIANILKGIAVLSILAIVMAGMALISGSRHGN